MKTTNYPYSILFLSADGIKKAIASADNLSVIVPHSNNNIHKVFFPPFKNKNYYKEASFDAVFDCVYEQIQCGVYLRAATPSLVPTNAIYNRKIGAKWIKQYEASSATLSEISDLLKNCFDSYPNLIEFENEPLPIELFLLRHLGKLVWQARYGPQSFDYKDKAKFRKIAKDQIDRILLRPDCEKNNQRDIPSSLYLQGFREYLHKITKHLQTKLRDHGPVNNIAQLIRIDSRLGDIENEGSLAVLESRAWRKVTDTFLAKFLGISVQGLEQKLKYESKFIKEFSAKKSPRKR